MDSSTDFEVSSFFNRANTKALTEARTTPVILVCIYNKNSTLITHEILHNVFSLYGTILRILIFEKVKVWKAFIEYSSVDEAVEAKRNLNDFLLFNDGTRMNIYFSNLDTVKFQNNNSGGIDYTQNDQKDFTEFKNEYSSPEIQQNINNQPEPITTFQSSYQNGSNTYEQYIERPSSNNNSSQPNSAQLKWPAQPQVPDPDEDFLNFLNRQPIDKEPSKYEPENDSKQDLDDLDKEHLIQQFFNDGFSNNRGQQNLSFDNKPKGQQSLKLQSQPFNDPSQNSMHPSLQNSTPFWPQSLNNSNNNNNAAPPGLSFYSGSTQSSMQEPKHFHNELPKIMRMPGSLPHINLHHNPSPHNTPPISRHSTFTDLPQTNSLNSGSMNPTGLLPPRHATFTDLPKPSMLPKPSLSHFGSMSHLPVSKSQQQQGPGPSPFGSLGGGVMNQQGSMNQIPQINKPSLNPRFASKPELPLASEISKMKLNDLSSQNVRDLIERDILLRLMMNNLQNQEGSDYLQQNPEMMEDLNEIKKFNPALSGLGNIDYNDLSQMNKGALDQIYQNLSSLLGKGVENKECAVLYVKGLEDENIKVQMLYNIFSNFGNIKKIIFIRRQAAALIEYETVEYATKAKDYLNNIVFMGKPLRIYYSFHPIINLKNKKSGKDSSEEIFLGTPKTFRFKKTKLLSMNPPSSTLHVSNLPKEICSEEIMRSAFSPFGRIEAIQFKFMDNNRNMCLIRMASMEESLNAMAHLHDLDLGGRPMQISFTKSKI